VGSSPRASIALDRAARAHAWLAGQDHVTPENVRAVAPDVLRHRLILSYEANADRVSPDAVLERLISLVAVA
jgi:MoxR-like ATPase